MTAAIMLLRRIGSRHSHRVAGNREVEDLHIVLNMLILTSTYVRRARAPYSFKNSSCFTDPQGVRLDDTHYYLSALDSVRHCTFKGKS